MPTVLPPETIAPVPSTSSRESTQRRSCPEVGKAQCRWDLPSIATSSVGHRSCSHDRQSPCFPAKPYRRVKRGSITNWRNLRCRSTERRCRGNCVQGRCAAREYAYAWPDKATAARRAVCHFRRPIHPSTCTSWHNTTLVVPTVESRSLTWPRTRETRQLWPSTR
jgi:hypothetical protein